MEYYSESNRPSTIPNPVTSKFVKKYEEVIDKDGKVKLKEVETINLYDKIQEAAEGVTLRELITKYQLKIDDWDLTKIDQSIYDLTDIPDNPIDAMNLINHAKSIFEECPQELRDKFNNNFNEFLIGASNGTLKSLLMPNTLKSSDILTDAEIKQQSIPSVPENVVNIGNYNGAGDNSNNGGVQL